LGVTGITEISLLPQVDPARLGMGREAWPSWSTGFGSRGARTDVSEPGEVEEVGAAGWDQTLRPKAGRELRWWGRTSSLRSGSS